MSITVKINTVDKTSLIADGSVNVVQRLTSEVDTASFQIRKTANRTLAPAYGDAVEIYDGATKIFGGTILSSVQTPATGPDGIVYDVRCVDHTYDLDRILASKTYENETIQDIISDLVSSYAPTFTTNNVSSTFTIEKIVFNQVPISTCLKRLADILMYDWYVDEDKDIHFFNREANSAPFELTDSNGNYVYKSLKRMVDGSQVVNRVKVRGGVYVGSVYTDVITVSGDDSKSFRLPYRFTNLTIDIDVGAGWVSQDVGDDFVDDFTSYDVLYNKDTQSIRFESEMLNGDLIRFSGNRDTPVIAIAEDPDSIASYGVVEKLIRDDSIASNEVARRRAMAELYAYSEPIVDASFTTRTAGLRSGMLINTQSDIQGFDESLIIKTITFKQIDPSTFGYKVDLVSTKRNSFLTLLQKLIEPDPRPSDEVEISEQIYTDTQQIEVQEDIEMVTPVNDNQEIETQENYEIDPFGPDTDAIYVLGPYSPSSQSDTKRPGRLNISLVVY